MKGKKLEKDIKNISSTNITNNQNNYELNMNFELNNKISNECSNLINEIKRKNKVLLSPIQTDKKGLYIKKSILLGKNNNLNTRSSINNKNDISTLSNLNRFERNCSKIIFRDMINITPKSISVNSLFNLPKIKSRNNIGLSQRIIKNNNFSLNLHKKNYTEERYNKKNNIFGIKHFMKENFYSDVEKKYKNQIKTKYFRNDSVIKNEIITIKKIGIFWNRFIEYCEPIIKFKKYQLFRKNSDRKFDIKKIKIIKSSPVSNSKTN